jgi:hypothetical protein
LVAALREPYVREKKAWREFGSKTVVCAYLLHVAAGV